MSSSAAQESAFRRADAIVSRCRANAPNRTIPAQLVADTLLTPGENAMHAREAQEQERQYKGWFYVGISIIANRIASQPLHIGKRIKSTRVNRRHFEWLERNGLVRTLSVQQKKHLPSSIKATGDTIELIDSDPLLQALDNPNPIMVRWQLMASTIAELLLTGKAYWWLPKVKGRYQIWPVPASWLYPTDNFHTSYTLQPSVEGFRFAEGEKLPGSEVIYFSLPDPGDPFQAVSPLLSQANAVYCDESIQSAQARTFRNGGMPALAIIAGDVTDPTGAGGPPLLSVDQRNQILDGFRKMFQGPAKWGSYILLDRLIRDVKPITNKPNEMDFLNSANTIQKRILMALKVNPIVAGQVESANRASSVSAAEHLAENAVNPLIELMSQILTRRVTDSIGGDPDMVAWLEMYRPDDREARFQEMWRGASQGAVCPDEFRMEILGLPPLPNGAGKVQTFLPKTIVVPLEGHYLHGKIPDPIAMQSDPRLDAPDTTGEPDDTGTADLSDASNFGQPPKNSGGESSSAAA